MIELGILGPLLLQVDDEQVCLGPALSVLALALLCARGAAVPIARLGGLLAEPDGNPTVAATVRSHVSHLRKALQDGPGRGQGSKVLVSGKVGGAAAYALRPEAIDTDATRFDFEIGEGLAELREGNYRAAAAVLRDALSLWRGDPLVDAAGRPFAQDWIEHLEDRHRQGVIARVAADVGAMRHADVTGELDRMARRWPDDEVIRALHAVSLYRSRRPAAAAAACQDAIRAAQSHGVDSPRLHQLQRDVLNGTLPETGLPYLPWTNLASTALPHPFHALPHPFHAGIGRLRQLNCSLWEVAVPGFGHAQRGGARRRVGSGAECAGGGPRAGADGGRDGAPRPRGWRRVAGAAVVAAPAWRPHRGEGATPPGRRWCCFRTARRLRPRRRRCRPPADGDPGDAGDVGGGRRRSSSRTRCW